ncbi:hypothetical protein AB6A40_011157, partial [Gnathostoma spinigerum]
MSRIYSELNNAWNELDHEMETFKVFTDDIWVGMVGLGAGTAETRIRRQTIQGYSATDIDQNASEVVDNSCCPKENNCPPGPPGAVGLPGLDGTDGPNGVDGMNAPNNAALPFSLDKTGECFHC